MRYIIQTIGCQMNICQSDEISKELNSKGLIKVLDRESADIIILNTCSVRAQAEQKAFSFLGRVCDLKQKNEAVKIIVIGCMAQRMKSKIKKRFKQVDLIIGTDRETPEIVNQILQLININNEVESPVEFLDLNTNNEVSKFVTITKGCSNYCSYCVVPFVRGKERARDFDEIIEECRNFSKQGAREVILLGQNVNSYNFNGFNFVDLLKEVSKISSIKRISFMTNHPKDLTLDLIQTIASFDKISKHVHLPLQSGSDEILKKMNRNYTLAHYKNLISLLRQNIKNISITTDVIVGFPSETDEDFLKTLETIKEIAFDGLYVFKYSPRPNTLAATFIDDVSQEKKKERLAIILKESNDISQKIVAGMVNTKQTVLITAFNGRSLEGQTETGRKVFMEGGRENIGKLCSVFITSAKINSLFGEICNEI
ncbi:MAG: tRNA (N6-isopentenyl adenosine(37)-C2)-methylthiotransferase MiaB [Elusimicrobiota bacterium]|jgi:tRNA-2-methylthio-N6-dimethylallyladenosine synthase|nr:tRNA (N6-isopentenyl adenosine(37)-C2)-methylthiotransferase MiaB [Elusimicrobiota bacterium]